MRKKTIMLSVILGILTACGFEKEASLDLKEGQLKLPLYDTVSVEKFEEMLTEESRSLENLSWTYCVDGNCQSLKEFQETMAKEYNLELAKDEIPIVENMSVKVCESLSKEKDHCLDLDLELKKAHQDKKQYIYKGKPLVKKEGRYVIEDFEDEFEDLEIKRFSYRFGEYRLDESKKEKLDPKEEKCVCDDENIILKKKQKKEEKRESSNQDSQEKKKKPTNKPAATQKPTSKKPAKKKPMNNPPAKEKPEKKDEHVIIPNSEAHNIDVLVNRKRRLASDFEPNWVYMDAKYAVDKGYRVQKDAAEAFMLLADTAEEELGKRVYITSSFRPYSSQKNLYDNYVAKHGLEKANRFSAQPGASEHQTGLAIDVVGENRDMWNFGQTEEAKWLHANAHRFGFILRYPEGKEHITGYMPEAWHIRYVGKDLAHDIYERGITLEEYYQ